MGEFDLLKNKYGWPLLLAVFVNLVLFVVKLYVGLRTNSLCIYTDSINNLLDSLSILLAFCGMFFVKKSATEKHPFGFGRIEYLLEFVMSVIISATGLSFAYNSLVRLMMPTPVWFYEKYAILIFATCLIKFILAIFFLYKYKKTKSDIMKTIMLDSFMDTGVTSVALVSFTLTNRLGLAVDGLMGLIISVFIIVSGVKLICSSVSKLIGKEDSQIVEYVKNTINNLGEKVSQKNILVYDYGTNSKSVLVVLEDSKEVDKKIITSKIKSKIINNNITNIYVAWEDKNV